MSATTTTQTLRAPQRWTDVVVIDSYPVYAPHVLVSRYDGVPTWDLARVLNLAASTLARGRAFNVAECERFSTITRDCDIEVIEQALREYDPARPEVAAVQAAIDALVDVQCIRCHVQHLLRERHRCTAAARRSLERRTAALLRHLP
jgi:hypothetical protein